ncbi:MAG: hypothetical protein HY670_10865 [Chloroflexi bacterium]|nr:hypothetical protein [Chloroflexota bacterium]
MWVQKYLVCLLRKHIFIVMHSQDSFFHYCLRCGKVENEHAVTHPGTAK